MDRAADTVVIRSEWVAMEQMAEAVLGAAHDFAGLLRALAPDEVDRPVPGLRWTVGETAAHVASLTRRGDRRGATFEELADLNAAQIEEIDVRDPVALADMVIADLEDLMERLSGLPAAFDIPLHLGLRADAPTVCSYFLGDLQVHGHDIATATARPWKIEDQRGATTLLALLPAIGPWVKPDVVEGQDQTIALDLPGVDRPLVAHVGDGRYWVDRTAPVDSQRFRAQPSTVLLSLTGRVPADDAGVDTLSRWFLPI